MRNTIISILIASMTCTALAAATFAQEDKPVAKIGDMTITAKDLDRAAVDMGEQFTRVPEAQRKAAILDALIDIRVLAKEAEKENLGEDEAFKARLDLLRARALHNRYFQEKIDKSITDEQIKARYDKDIVTMTPQKEVRARHILVKTEEEAKAVIKELEDGAKFEELAKSKSTGPSGPKGGDLGFFKQGQMVPEFEQAAFAMEPGSFTKEPVKTQFGFHVIKVEEKRDQPLPTLEATKQEIRQVLLRDAYTKAVAEARKAAGVEVLDPTLKPDASIEAAPKQ